MKVGLLPSTTKGESVCFIQVCVVHRLQIEFLEKGIRSLRLEIIMTAFGVSGQPFLGKLQ